MKPIRRWLVTVLLAGSVAAPAAGHEMAAKAGSDGRCDGPEFSCAMTATPVFARDGALWLAWNSASRVYAARSADHGRSFNTPVEITPEAAKLDHSADTRPQIVVDGPRQVTVGYAVMTAAFMHGQLYYAHSGDSGRTFSAPLPVNATAAGKRFLSLNVAPDGALFAAWIDKRDLAAAKAAGQEYRGAALYAAWSHDGGATFEKPMSIGQNTCECCRVAVDFAGSGNPVVVWRNLFGETRDHAITTFTGATTPGPIHRISDDNWEIDACPHQGPTLAVADDGTYHVAWFTASDTRQGLFYARSTDAGATFSAPMPIGDPARQPTRPRLLAQGDKIWLAWREYDGKATKAVVMESHNGGKDWSSPKVVGSSVGVADHPLLVSDGSRTFVSWLTRDDGYRLLPLD